MKINNQSTKKYPVNFINESLRDGDFRSSNGFEWFLELEKQRNLRNGGFVCVVTIDFAKILGKYQGQKPTSDLDKAWKDFLGGLTSNTRESDILFNVDRQIKLILTNTFKEGAYVACNRIFFVVKNLIQKTDLSNYDNPGFEIGVDVWDYNSKMKYTTVLSDNEDKKELCRPMPSKT